MQAHPDLPAPLLRLAAQAPPAEVPCRRPPPESPHVQSASVASPALPASAPESLPGARGCSADTRPACSAPASTDSPAPAVEYAYPAAPVLVPYRGILMLQRLA